MLARFPWNFATSQIRVSIIFHVSTQPCRNRNRRYAQQHDSSWVQYPMFTQFTTNSCLAFTDSNHKLVEDLVSELFFVPITTATTMMNFRVAPNLPMSFGFHGDLPVLTKRTIWYLQASLHSFEGLLSRKLTFLETGVPFAVSRKLPYIHTSRSPRYSMMSNTSTIKCRSIMTSKLVRLPDKISWRKNILILHLWWDRGWPVMLTEYRGYYIMKMLLLIGM